MRWIDRYGDRDRDGFQEYQTRSSHGYYNQGWKDAGDAIPDADGTLAPLPIATCRAPGLRLRREARGWPTSTTSSAARRTPAGCGARPQRLYERVNERVLVGGGGHLRPRAQRAKQQIRSVASNAGHLLAVRDRAGRSGRGGSSSACWPTTCGRAGAIRTLSSDHPAYNPFSYQHGIGLAARQRDDRGRFPALRLRRRGGTGARRASSTRPSGSPATRLPELFAGLPRVPRPASRSSTSGANVPQAWAAGRDPPAHRGPVPASMRRPSKADRSSTSTRRCPTGCRR